MPARHRASARPHPAYRSPPSVTHEVREIHSSVTRLEHRLADQRSEFKRLRLLDSRANTDTIVGSTLVGMGLFLVSGVPLPDSLGAVGTTALQLAGAGLGAIGLLVLMRAYREWRAFLAHRTPRRRGHRLVGGVLVLLVLAAGGYAGLKVAATLGWHLALPGGWVFPS